MRRFVRYSAWAIVTVGAMGCESIFGIGTLPHGTSEGDDGSMMSVDAAAEAETGSSCVAIDAGALPATGAAACQGTTACSPKSVTDFSSIWVPPVPNMHHCTAAQIDTVLTSCGSTTSTFQTCQTWITANSTCASCAVTNPNTTALGATVFAIPGIDFLQLNIAGCIYEAEPCNKPCAEAVLDELLCAYQSCDPTSSGNCPVTDQASFTTQQDCLTASITPASPLCACGGYGQASNCANAITGPAKTVCIDPPKADLPRVVVSFMCGPA